MSNSDNKSDRAEKWLKVITTYGLSVVVSIVLLGYFLWKDFHTSQSLVEAVNNNTKAMEAMTIQMEMMNTQVGKNTDAISSLRVGK